MRSGNSWMSVAPFRDLETEPTARGQSTSTCSARPSGEAPPCPALPQSARLPGLVQAGSAEQGPSSHQLRRNRQPQHSKSPSKQTALARNRGSPVSAVTAQMPLRRPWAAGFAVRARGGVSPKLSSPGASPAPLCCFSLGRFSLVAFPSLLPHPVRTWTLWTCPHQELRKVCCRTPNRQRGARRPGSGAHAQAGPEGLRRHLTAVQTACLQCPGVQGMRQRTRR